MINLRHDAISSILCLGAHADDIEIGCGGTILKLLSENPGIDVTWVVLSGADQRRSEAQRSADQFLQDAGGRNVIVQDFPDSFFPYRGERIKRFFHDLAGQVNPDLVFTHRSHDAHQDHRLVNELTWNTFRNHLILEYEIPKYEGDLGHPNVYVPLDESISSRKVDLIVNSFPSQHDKPWFSSDTFRSLLRIRGLECHAKDGHAEGLYCRKLML